MTVYLDTNVLLYAFAAEGHPQRAPARGAIERCAVASRIVTSFLTIDESIWALRRVVSYEQAVHMAFRILDLPLEILPIGPREGIRALHLMQEPGLHPHDATHAAVALEHGCKEILSTDPDFDAVEGLRRVSIL